MGTRRAGLAVSPTTLRRTVLMWHGAPLPGLEKVAEHVHVEALVPGISLRRNRTCCRPLRMLRKQHAGCGVASDGTAESMTATCRARAVHERMPVWKSVQLKGGGRGGGPPCGALERSSAMNMSQRLTRSHSSVSERRSLLPRGPTS